MATYTVHRTLMSIAAIVLFLACASIPPAHASMKAYPHLTKTFDKSEIALRGNASRKKRILDQDTLLPCGALLSIGGAKIHRSKNGRVSISKPTTLQISLFNPHFQEYISQEKGVLVFGALLNLSKTSTGKPDGSRLFSPANPYITAKNPYSGKGIFVDCSELYPKTLKYIAISAYEITAYQIAGQAQTANGDDSAFDVVAIRWEEIPKSPKDRPILDIILQGLRGWQSWDGHTVICLTREDCAQEAESIRTPAIETPGTINYHVSGARYLIEVDAILKAFDAYKAKSKAPD